MVLTGTTPTDEEFWSLVDLLDGSVTDESLERLAGALRAPPADQVVAFQDRLASLVGLTRRQKSHPVALGVADVLERWSTSAVYARAVDEGGFGLLSCHGALYDPRIPGAVTGTWWRARRGPGVLKVTLGTP